MHLILNAIDYFSKIRMHITISNMNIEGMCIKNNYVLLYCTFPDLVNILEVLHEQIRSQPHILGRRRSEFELHSREVNA